MPIALARLRPFRAADAPALTELFADPDTRRWNPGPEPDRLEQWWTGNNTIEPDFRTWAVADGEQLVGTVSLFSIDADQGTAEIGYRIHPAHRRRGLGSAALRAAAELAFRELGVHRIVLFHAVENPGSCGVATRSGFLLEGTLRQSHRYPDGIRCDEHLHARLDSDPA